MLIAFTTPLATPKPNFILLMADDVGWGDLSYNSARAHNPGAGNESYVVNPAQTPELDEMANGPNSLLFHRFYAGSAVCSPTRASALTGRTSDRDCISTAEGCGQEPAWSCPDNLPLSPRTWTIAEAAKAQGYATIHVGKWHLGNFFPKRDGRHDWPNERWPTSSPRVHGFDEWASTEASASSSMCNCGCEASWATSPAGDPGAGHAQGSGCVTGGGDFGPTALECTNYWSPTDLDDATHAPTNPRCALAPNATLDSCVTNLTSKIAGDDSRHIVDVFEEFLARKAPGGSEASPFLAVLWLHTNHRPHPAMPEWFHAYADANGQPAGDYLGTLSQMDAQVGRLRRLLRTHGVANDTALFFTADNGPHTADGGGCVGAFARASNQATNGLRQCKASLYEGGIREPGVLEWPRMVHAHAETSYPAFVADYLPTFLEATGARHPHPGWAADGVSLMPLLRAAQRQRRQTGDVEVGGSGSGSGSGAAGVVSLVRRRPLGFQLGAQQAWIDNGWKLVRNGAKGQCATMLPPYTSGEGSYLFDLDADPTESHDLSAEQPGRFAAMRKALDSWAATIVTSQVEEAQCKAPKAVAAGAGVEVEVERR